MLQISNKLGRFVALQPHKHRHIAGKTKFSLPLGNTFGEMTFSFLLIAVGSIGRDVTTSGPAECGKAIQKILARQPLEIY